MQGGYGCVEHDPKWFERQAKEKDWRPENYYDQLARRWENCENPYFELMESQDWTGALLKVFRAYEDACEAVYPYEEDLTPSTDHEVEVIREDSDEEDVVYVVQSDKSWMLDDFINYFHLPKQDYDTSSAKAFAESISKSVSRHWIVEMYSLFVKSYGDMARCHPIEWDYSL